MNSHLLSTLKSTLKQCFDQEKKLYLRILIAAIILYLLNLGLNNFTPKFAQHILDFTGSSKDDLVKLAQHFIQVFVMLLSTKFIFLGTKSKTSSETIGSDLKKIGTDISSYFKLYLSFLKEIWKALAILSLWFVVLPIGIISNSKFFYGSYFFDGFDIIL